MRRRQARRTPERILLAWVPFLCGAFVVGLGLESGPLVFANLLGGLVFAVFLAGTTRTTRALIGLLPRTVVLVLAGNLVAAVVLFVLERI